MGYLSGRLAGWLRISLFIRALVPLAICALVSGVARHLVAEAAHVLQFSALSGAALLLMPELLARFLHDVTFVAKVFVRRAAVLTIVLAWHVALAILLTAVWSPTNRVEFSLDGALRFFVNGAIVGLVIRWVSVKYLMRMLRGATTEEAEAALLTSVAGYLWSFPTSPPHDAFAPAYLVGIAAGCLVHFLVRSSDQGAAARARMRQLLPIELGSFPGDVADAIEMYLDRRWRALRKFLPKIDLTTAPLVGSIEASMDWFLGDHRRALLIVEQELREHWRNRGYVTSLLIVKALCLADQRKLAAAVDALEQAQKRTPSCLLCKVLRALFLAWQVPLTGQRTLEQQARLDRAFTLIFEAMAQAEADRLNGHVNALRARYKSANERVNALLVGTVHPVSKTFLLGTYAYISFRCGQTMLAESEIDDCLTRDQKSAYLQLYRGEVHLALSRMTSSDEEERRKSRRRAEIALHIAIELEVHRDSAIKQRAMDLLQEATPPDRRAQDAA